MRGNVVQCLLSRKDVIFDLRGDHGVGEIEYMVESWVVLRICSG